MDPRLVIDFWFSDEAQRRWFRSTAEFDEQIRARFHSLWEKAKDRRLDHWVQTPEGALALVIVLDQFPLNMFRGAAEGYSTESLAREAADHAIQHRWDADMDDARKAFFYLPFMHSESLADQDRSVQLYRSAGLIDSLRWAEHHREIIQRFGRFPHRNAALGRVNTPEETAWLTSDEAFHG